MVAVAVAAAAQAVGGLGFSLLAIPFLTLSTGVEAAVPTINLLAGGLNAVMLAAERAHARWRDAALLLIPAAVVAPIVGYYIRRLPTDTLSIVMGVLVLASAVILATGARAHSLRGRRGALIAGGLSGGMNVAGGVGGPPVAMYGVNADWPARSFRPTLQANFLGLNIISVTVRGFPSLSDPWEIPRLAAAALAGWLIGQHYAKSIDDNIVRNFVLGMAGVGGMVAIIRGIF